MNAYHASWCSSNKICRRCYYMPRCLLRPDSHCSHHRNSESVQIWDDTLRICVGLYMALPSDAATSWRVRALVAEFLQAERGLDCYMRAGLQWSPRRHHLHASFRVPHCKIFGRQQKNHPCAGSQVGLHRKKTASAHDSQCKSLEPSSKHYLHV